MKGVDVMDCRVEVVDLIDIVREEVGDSGGEDGIIDGNEEFIPDLKEIPGDLPLGMSSWFCGREESVNCSEGDCERPMKSSVVSFKGTNEVLAKFGNLFNFA